MAFAWLCPFGATGAAMKRFLVTAGNTREMIDQVRDWGNIFTGNTGYAIARALAEVGQVDLLTSNLAHLAEVRGEPRGPVTGFKFRSHEDLRALLDDRMGRGPYDAVLMTAAVADYRPTGTYAIESRTPLADGRQQWIVRDVQSPKISSTHQQIAVAGEPTQKLVDLFRSRWNHRGVLVKFKLQVGMDSEELIRIGQASRRASGAEYLVANTLDMLAGENPGAWLLSEHGHEWVKRDALPGRLRDLLR
jgi:phosphopantothenoylcysteine decarboxylase/phosphopantothenate--cysteine ligase